jgi:hypothetical protein
MKIYTVCFCNQILAHWTDKGVQGEREGDSYIASVFIYGFLPVVMLPPLPPRYPQAYDLKYAECKNSSVQTCA